MKLLKLIKFRLNIAAISLCIDDIVSLELWIKLKKSFYNLWKTLNEEKHIAYLNLLKEMELDLYQQKKVQTPITIKWINILETEYKQYTQLYSLIQKELENYYIDEEILLKDIREANMSKEDTADIYLEVLAHIKTLINPSLKIPPTYYPSDPDYLTLDHFWENRISLIELDL